MTSNRCDHSNWKPRRRVISGGLVIVCLQCLDCAHSRALKKADYPNIDALEPFDEDLMDRLWRQRSLEDDAKRSEEIEARSREWWDRYNEYLASPEWRARRNKVMKRANWTCEACLERKASQVHHTTYAHVCNEPLFELRAVCDECHETITSLDRSRVA